MLSPQQLYPVVVTWCQGLHLTGHRTADAALAHRVVALLTGQSLRPAALMRALWSPQVVPARPRYRRVRRCWERRWLQPAWLTARLVRAVLALRWPPTGGRGPGAAARVVLVLDSVRCGPWELFTLGVVWGG